MAHMRTFSNDSSVSSASSYKLILEHILAYPGSYEMPLRTMYTLNCISRAQLLPQHLSRPATPSLKSPTPSPTLSSFTEMSPTQAATAQFTSALFTQVARLPSQPCSLPPVFISSFLRRCFTLELDLVDFPQALTALDYLKDIESRRRREGRLAFERLGIDREQLNIVEEEAWRNNAHPRLTEWVDSMERSETKVEALYSQLFVALRRWILINELSLLPFNKHNCLAMLNTLYPPTSVKSPTTKLTPEVLKRQRDTFFRYIQAVERRGPHVLQPLIKQKTNPGDDNGWPFVRQVLDNYLRVAMNLIDDCTGITDVEGLISPPSTYQSVVKRPDRKVDSGISIETSDAVALSTVNERKRSPDEDSTMETPATKKPYSTLARLARNLRKLKTMGRTNAPGLPALKSSVASKRMSRTDSLRESIEAGAHQAREFGRAIKRLRSISEMRGMSRGSTLRGDNTPVPPLPQRFE